MTTTIDAPTTETISLYHDARDAALNAIAAMGFTDAQFDAIHEIVSDLYEQGRQVGVDEAAADLADFDEDEAVLILIENNAAARPAGFTTQ